MIKVKRSDEDKPWMVLRHNGDRHLEFHCQTVEQLDEYVTKTFGSVTLSHKAPGLLIYKNDKLAAVVSGPPLHNYSAH